MDTEVVTRIRAGSIADPDSGDSVESWAPGDVSEVSITTLAPAEPRPASRPLDEPLQDARNAVTNGFTLYLPLGSDVTARDRMGIRGGIYRVMGEPALWLNRGFIVQTERTEG